VGTDFGCGFPPEKKKIGGRQENGVAKEKRLDSVILVRSESTGGRNQEKPPRAGKKEKYTPTQNKVGRVRRGTLLLVHLQAGCKRIDICPLNVNKRAENRKFPCFT